MNVFCEIEAVKAVLEALCDLDADERERVVNYAIRYHEDRSKAEALKAALDE